MMNNKFFEKWIDRARVISTEIDRDFKHVSLIFDRQQRLISLGTNQWKTHPRSKELGYLFAEPHSELSAHLKVPKFCTKTTTLVNFRFNKRGQLRLAKPCSICMGWSLCIFDKIVYSTNEGMVLYEKRSGKELLISKI